MPASRKPSAAPYPEHVRPRLDIFLDWCAENEIELHPELEIHPSLEIPAVPHDKPDWTKDDVVHHGMFISTAPATPGPLDKMSGKRRYVRYVPLAAGSAARIPRSAILSAQNSSLRRYDPSFQPPTMGGTKLQNIQCSALAVPRLALCLLHEYLIGPASRWWPYLAILPPYGVDLPRMWRKDSPEYALILGSEVGYTLQRMHDAATDVDPDHCATDRFLKAYFDKEGANHLERAHPTLVDLDAAETSGPSTPRLEHLHHRAQTRPLSRRELWILYDRAASLVSTRAFVVDLYHVLAMVPIADAFNHSGQPDVEFDCHDVVCTQCGSRRQCEHERPQDEDDMEISDEDDDDALILRQGLNLRRRGKEVCNSYGDYSPIQLLIRYGWVLRFDVGARGDFATRWSSPLESTPDAVELRAALKLPMADVAQLVDVVDKCLSVTRDAAPRHFHFMEEELADAMSIPTQDPILEQDSSDPARPYFIDNHVMNDRLWLLVLAAAVLHGKGRDDLDSRLLLELNKSWWHPKTPHSEFEKFGERAIKMLQELVNARIAKLTMPFSSEHLSQIDHDVIYRKYVGSSATGAAVRCIHAEKTALETSLHTIRDVAKFETRKDLWRRYELGEV